jgi:hypothetical protein
MSWDFDRLLRPLSVPEFLEARYDGGAFRLPGTLGKFSELFSWAELSALVEHHVFNPTELQLLDKGKRLPADRLFRERSSSFGATDRRKVDSAALMAELRAGKSLLLTDVHHLSPRIGEASRAIARACGEEVRATLIASTAESQGFLPHWDNEDTLIVQVDGQKRWRLYGQAEALHEDLTSGLQRAPDRRPDEILVGNGDAIWVPRAWWHDAQSVAGPALQIMFWITRRTGLDLLGELHRRCLTDPRFLAPLSRFAPVEEKRARARAMREALVDLFGDGAIDGFFRTLDEVADLPSTCDLPWSASPEALAPELTDRVQLHLPSRASVDLDEESGEALLRAGGQQWAFPAATRRLLTLLMSSKSYAVAELCQAVDADADEVRAFLGELVSAGLVVRDRG